MRRAWSGIVGLIALAVLLGSLVAVADRRLAAARLDLTAGRILSLSPGSRQIVANLAAPVTLKLYESRNLAGLLPGLSAHADRVRALLAEYARRSNGHVRLQTYGPEPFSETEDRAIAAGLQAIPSGPGQEPVYFGLAGSNLLDDRRAIAFFQPDRARFLEYDISRLIHDLGEPQRPVIGVLSDLPIDGDSERMMRGEPGGAPWVSMIQLRDAFTVRRVPLDATAIDPDIQVLAVIGPHDLSDGTQYAIDQFVMRGGRLLAFVDPHSESRAADPAFDSADAAAMSSDLPKLFAAYKIGFDAKTVIGDTDGAWRVRSRAGTGTGEGGAGETIDYLPWFNLRDGIAPDDPATANLTSIGVAAPGSITSGALAMTPLLTTSREAGPIPRASVSGQPDPAAIADAFHPDGIKHVIAARLRGKLHSAFDGPPKGIEGYVAETANPADIAVVADTDVLDDRFWVRVRDVGGHPQAEPFNDNGAFFVNLVGTLAGGDALLALRGRGDGLRPMALFDRLRQRAELDFRAAERNLRRHLDDTAAKLAALRAGQLHPGDVPDATMATLAADVTTTRGRLRDVQRDLRARTDAIAAIVRFCDVALVPLLLVAATIALALFRRRRTA